MKDVLSTQSLSKQYGKHKVLDNINMHIPKGAIYGLIGKNGAGKTTLFRVITGLQDPTAGSYSLFGTSNFKRDISKARHRTGAVIEAPAMYLDMTAQDNLKEQFRILGRPSFEGIDDLLSLVGLEKTEKKKVKDFSFGMQQRLGIALALAGDPDFLLLDEPVNGLDPQGIIEIRELILKLNREKQITFLISSHILDELSKVATHYGFMNNAQLIEEISAEELEKLFKKAKRVKVDYVPALISYLDVLGLDYKVIEEDIIDIYDEINITDLALELNKRGCRILTVNDHNESIESYFLKRIGGNS